MVKPRNAPLGDPETTGEEGVAEATREANPGSDSGEEVGPRSELQWMPERDLRAGEQLGNCREELDRNDRASEEKTKG
ncbi:hypothetical protein NDU88_005782 [Pleurodeles waltl]|uniref:Uncharacterized protein n=1 Tax=Pleurodeles waltl TaxID=8319 RepID=A0AAV7MXA9_PLEWA|nr:hypothetical protein NDU88_005782 [Pleurodeles waltl]